MKRYLLFAGAIYYPEGGWKDFHSDHDTVEETLEVGRALMEDHVPPYHYSLTDWYHIVDSATGVIIEKRSK